MGLYNQRQLNFLDALTGFVLHPSDTIEELLSRESPPFMAGCVLALAATIFTPILAQVYKYDFVEAQTEYLAGFALVFALTGALFVLLEVLMLRMFRYDAPLSKIVAICCYALGPLVPLLLIYYGINMKISGRLTIVTFLLTGVKDADDTLIKFLPWFIGVAKISVIITFMNGLKNLATQSTSTALMVTLLSAIPFYAALIASTFIAQLHFPGSVRAVTEVITFLTQWQ